MATSWRYLTLALLGPTRSLRSLTVGRSGTARPSRSGPVIRKYSSRPRVHRPARLRVTDTRRQGEPSSSSARLSQATLIPEEANSAVEYNTGQAWAARSRACYLAVSKGILGK